MFGRRLGQAAHHEAAALSLPFQGTFRNKALFSLTFSLQDNRETSSQMLFRGALLKTLWVGSWTSSEQLSLNSSVAICYIIRYSTLNNNPK